jgi:rhodanese-related sulfurtransferase
VNGAAGARENFAMMAAVLTSNISLGHAGAVSAQEAWEALQTDPHALLLDVRTQPEWVFSGVPNLNGLGKQTQLISWKIYPTMEVNADFVKMVAQSVPNISTPIYCLCKSGGRSHDAALALTQAGYKACYNISDGFEGDRDAQGHRGIINGWKAAGLPWEQA